MFDKDDSRSADADGDGPKSELVVPGRREGQLYHFLEPNSAGEEETESVDNFEERDEDDEEDDENDEDEDDNDEYEDGDESEEDGEDDNEGEESEEDDEDEDNETSTEDDEAKYLGRERQEIIEAPKPQKFRDSVGDVADRADRATMLESDAEKGVREDRAINANNLEARLRDDFSSHDVEDGSPDTTDSIDEDALFVQAIYVTLFFVLIVAVVIALRRRRRSTPTVSLSMWPPNTAPVICAQPGYMYQCPTGYMCQCPTGVCGPGLGYGACANVPQNGSTPSYVSCAMGSQGIPGQELTPRPPNLMEVPVVLVQGNMQTKTQAQAQSCWLQPNNTPPPNSYEQPSCYANTAAAAMGSQPAVAACNDAPPNSYQQPSYYANTAAAALGSQPAAAAWSNNVTAASALGSQLAAAACNNVTAAPPAAYQNPYAPPQMQWGDMAAFYGGCLGANASSARAKTE